MPFRCFAVCQTSCNSIFFIRIAFVHCYITSFHTAEFRSMCLLKAHTQCFAWLILHLYTIALPRYKHMLHSFPFFAARSFCCTSLHSFQYCKVYALSIFVLACAACLCFGFVMVFQKTHAKPLRKRSSIAPLHGFFILHSCRHSQPHLSFLRLWLKRPIILKLICSRNQGLHYKNHRAICDF